MIIAVIYVPFAVAKRKPEKNSGLYGIRTLDLCDTGAMIFLYLILHSAVHIYDFHIFITSLFSILNEVK